MKTKQNKAFFVIGSLTCGMILSFFCLIPMARVLALNLPEGVNAGNMEEIMEDALGACEDASAGDKCSVSLDDKDISGICKENPMSAELMCLPEKTGGKAPGKEQGGNQGLNRVQAGMKKAQTPNEHMNVEQRMAKQKTNATRTISMVEKMIAYLESNEVDVTEIRSELEVFKTKTDELTSAYTEYSELINASEDIDNEVIKTARENITTLAKNTKAYFMETLKLSIQNALLEIS